MNTWCTQEPIICDVWFFLFFLFSIFSIHCQPENFVSCLPTHHCFFSRTIEPFSVFHRALLFVVRIRNANESERGFILHIDTSFSNRMQIDCFISLRDKFYFILLFHIYFGSSTYTIYFANTFYCNHCVMQIRFYLCFLSQSPLFAI